MIFFKKKQEKIVSRYERDPAGRVIIGVTIESINDLYNFFDRQTVYSKRDLDEEFVEYLTECATEIYPKPFIIRIDLERGFDKSRSDKIRKSIHNYFVYLHEAERRNLRKLFKRSAFLSFLGLSIILINVRYPDTFFSGQSILGKVISEGMIIAAWVALWEVFSNLIMEWYPMKQKIRIFKRIIEAEVRTCFQDIREGEK